MKKILLLAGAIIFLTACGGKKPSASSNAEENTRFDNYKNAFVERFWKVFPEWASSVGYHKYDSVLVLPDAASMQADIAFCKSEADSLKNFDLNLLSDNNKTDYYMLRDQLASIIWSYTEMKSYEWDPSSYKVSGMFAEMLNNNYDSLGVRLRNFYIKMKNIPAFYEAAKKNIVNPTLEHTQLAIDQSLGGISVFEKDFTDALAKVNFPVAEKEEMKARAAASVAAIKSYVDFLKTMKNDHPRSFRLGKELYEKKFEYDIQSGYTVNQIYEKALAHKKELHAEMAKISGSLWSKYFGNQPKPADTLQMIRQMIDKLSLIHVQADSFQSAIEQQIPVLVDFIKKKDLIYIDPAKPLVVRREPDYMAGIAGASISAPGPYDKNGNTYYNVGSLSGWDKDKAESYLREYNHYILQILNIHEAIPGHYTQLVYSNQSPSLIKSLFGSQSMVEGWAVYTERMMLENGYGNNEPEMWLMYYKWNLRSTCNTILDYSVHAGNMTKEEAMKLLVDEAFQQKTEAENKWRRVSLTQVQLCCYFTGYTEIYDLREELKKKMGDSFNLKRFHEKFLSYGSAPVKYIRELMLGEMEAEAKK
jgi:uncharacterized protein (DUF885 family)